MKGLIFTEFLEMVETKFSADMVDTIIDNSDLPSGGAYTSVGSYDHSEIVALVTALSAETKVPATELIHAYCGYLFDSFTQIHPEFFDGHTNSFDFLQQVDSYIHVEVKKLYPDAELPRFHCDLVDKNTLHMRYQSSRHLGDIAEGLMLGCISHFQEDVKIKRTDNTAEAGADILFVLEKDAGST